MWNFVKARFFVHQSQHDALQGIVRVTCQADVTVRVKRVDLLLFIKESLVALGIFPVENS